MPKKSKLSFSKTKVAKKPNLGYRAKKYKTSVKKK